MQQDSDSSEKPDSSSLKPVSSLRSRFENISAVPLVKGNNGNSTRQEANAAKDAPPKVNAKPAQLHGAAIPTSTEERDPSTPVIVRSYDSSQVNNGSHQNNNAENTETSSASKRRPPTPPQKRRASRQNQTPSNNDNASEAVQDARPIPAAPTAISARKDKPPPPLKKRPESQKVILVESENDVEETPPPLPRRPPLPIELVDNTIRISDEEQPPPLPTRPTAPMNGKSEAHAPRSLTKTPISNEKPNMLPPRPAGNITKLALHNEPDSIESRPQLPPRRATTAAVSPTVFDAPQPVVATSSKQLPEVTTGRPSALSQGFSTPRSNAQSRSTTPIPAPRGRISPTRAPALTTTQRLMPTPSATPPPIVRARTSPSRPNSALIKSFPSNDVDASSSQAVGSFPDCRRSNRRFPYFAEGPRTITIGYDLRLVAVCGECICVAGPVTRVWNLLSGKLLMSLTHGEGIKVTALAFRPARRIDLEGSRIWLGTNVGDLIEIDWNEKRTVAKNSAAHLRHEIVKIHRHGSDLWTIDDEGKLYVWPVESEGSPNLSHGIHSIRLTRGHTASIAVDGELWFAAGREISVIKPSKDPEKSQVLTAEPLIQAKLGEVTCCAIVPEMTDQVFFGHSDGKITVYSRKDLSCIETITASQYKVYCLTGVGDKLWAGFGNGRILVYDINQRPWSVRKEWRAHENLVTAIVTDQSSLWKCGRLQVVSLGIDNSIRTWDGLLTEDWLELEMLRVQEQYTTSSEVTARVLTWNVGAITPQTLRYDQEDSNFFRDFLQSADPSDIFVVGLQELVDLEDKALTAKSFFKSKKQDSYGNEHLSSAYRAWRDYVSSCLDQYTSGSDPYVLLHTTSLVGLFSCVFVKNSLRQRIRNVSAGEVKTGLGGLHGNKGALIVRFTVDDSSICFVNCHLAAGQTHTVNRNADAASILEDAPLEPLRLPESKTETLVCGGDGSMILDNEICIWSGDLNYRIDTMTRDSIVSAVRSQTYERLLERDQLLLSRRKQPTFRLRAFEEAAINFAPTYKYDPGTDDYDTSEKRRAPAWCDRILYRGPGKVQQLEYTRHEVRASDHRPVSGYFIFRVKNIHVDKRLDAWRQSLKAFDTFQDRVSTEAKLYYLTRIFGLSTEEAQNVLKG